MARQSSVSDRDYGLRLLLCLGAILALRLVSVYSSQIDLVPDEAQYWTWSRDLDFGYFSKPPLIAWLIRGVSELCGQSEACLRSASPVLYTLASVMIFLTGRALFEARIGFWSAIVFATLPGVSYSSQLITTDVPLILLWTVMLYFWVMLVKRQSMSFAILLGVAIGVGLLAKQAMIYAALCIICHAIVSREAREALKGGRGIVAALIALALFSPNIVWNAQHDFPTARHTGANIGWQHPYVHPVSLIEYVGVQFGVFGPILLVVLARAGWREMRHPSDQGKVLLLAFSVPVLVLLLFQALLSRAHGNWSATAYPAATIFVTAVMLELNRLVLFRISLAIHLALAVIIAAAPAFARDWPLFERFHFLRSVMGWHRLADAVNAKLSAEPYGALLVDTREMAGEMLYYLREAKVPLYVWAPGPLPHNHYEMTRPFTAEASEPVLLVSLRRCAPSITRSFASVRPLGTERVPIVASEAREVHFCRLAGYGDAPEP